MKSHMVARVTAWFFFVASAVFFSKDDVPTATLSIGLACFWYLVADRWAGEAARSRGGKETP